MNKHDPIYVAGHQGLVGAAIVRALRAAGHDNLLLRTRAELDLTRQAAVEDFFAREKPAYVFLAAARVGGIKANSSYPADFIRDNLQIQDNIIVSAREQGARKLLFLGSSCIYPKLAPQPLREEYLLTGPLEPTNEWYAVAKIAGIKLCQAYRRQYGFDAISIMPTNLYGPGDNFHPENAHVLPALMRRFHEAREAGAERVTIWGSGTPRREFLHVDDLAAATLFLMSNYSGEDALNVGVGSDLTILELARAIAATTGFRGEIDLDRGKPDGTPQKLLDVSKINALGWQARIPLATGLRQTYEWFLANAGKFRG